MGDGPGVVCLHSNASTSAQWRPLMELLSDRFKVVAPDTLGAGMSPEWPDERSVTLFDEARFLEPAFAEAGKTVSVVGHSYGGAIALAAATVYPERIRSMVLIEPTLFALLAEEEPDHPAFEEAYDVASAATRNVEDGELHEAARHFIDYWTGTGSWDAMPAQLRDLVATSMRNVAGWAEALRDRAIRLEHFTGLEIPVLYILGERSPESSRAVARLLIPALRQVEVEELEGLGHMAAISHPHVVNPLIEEFLGRHGVSASELSSPLS